MNQIYFVRTCYIEYCSFCTGDCRSFLVCIYRHLQSPLVFQVVNFGQAVPVLQTCAFLLHICIVIIIFQSSLRPACMYVWKLILPLYLFLVLSICNPIQRIQEHMRCSLWFQMSQNSCVMSGLNFKECNMCVYMCACHGLSMQHNPRAAIS